jgi:serine/threonine protein kinase
VNGKYRVEHVLGEGGMGIAVAARHLDLEELYAIKVMKREARDRLLRHFLWTQSVLGAALEHARRRGDRLHRLPADRARRGVRRRLPPRAASLALERLRAEVVVDGRG